jgi:hypothetical protein
MLKRTRLVTECKLTILRRHYRKVGLSQITTATRCETLIQYVWADRLDSVMIPPLHSSMSIALTHPHPSITDDVYEKSSTREAEVRADNSFHGASTAS